MATYSAGTAFLEIIPSFEGVQRAIAREVRQMEKAFGKNVGETLGGEIEKGMQRAVDRALGTSKGSAAKAGKEAADDYAGAFERSVRTRIAAALRNFPDIQFDADISEAQEKLMVLRARLLELGDKKIGVDIDAQAALAEIEFLRRELARVATDESIDIQVRTDAAEAVAELLQVRTVSKLIDDTKVDITVDLDDRGILSRLAALRAGMTQAGRSGEESANAFRAFNGVILGAVTLLPAVIPVAGAAAGAIALLGTAGVGAAFGLAVMGIAFSGIGDAVTALGKQQQNAGRDALAAEKTMRTAARGVEDAQRGVERATTQAGQAGVRAARAVADAVDEQRSAEQDLTRAQADVVRAQEAVTRARADAQEQIEDLQLSLRGGALAERQAVLDLTEAQNAWNEAQSQPDLSADDRAQLLLDLDKAALNLDVVRERNGDLTAEQAEWARTGVDGSRQVVAAQDGVRDAQDRVSDAQDRLADAADAVADAVDAQRQVQVDSAQAIEDANRNLSQAQEDYQTALYETGTLGSASMQAVAVAMGALGPAGQDFALFLDSIRGKLRDLRDVAQAGMLPGVEDAIDRILTRNGPLLTDFIDRMSRALGEGFRQVGILFTNPAWQSIFGALADYAPIFITQFGEIGMNLLRFFGELFVALAPYAVRFNDNIVDITASMAEWADGLTENAGFRAFMDWLFREGPGIWEVVLDIFRAIGNVVVALAPMGQLVLDLIGYAADFIAEMDPQVLGIIITAVLGLVGAFQLALGAFSLAMIVMDALLSPFTRWIFLAGAVATGLVILYTQSETFRAIVDGVFRALGAVISWWWEEIVSPIFTFVREGFELLGRVISAVWNDVLKPIFDGLTSGSWDGLAEGLTTAGGNIKTGLEDIGRDVWDFVKPGGTLDQNFLNAWAGLTNNLTDETNENSAAYKIGAWFRGLAEDVWNYTKPGGTLDMVMWNTWDGLSGSLDDETDEESASYKISKWFRELPGKVWEWVKPGGDLDQKFIGMWDGIERELAKVDLSYELGRLAGSFTRWWVDLNDEANIEAAKFWDKVKPGGDVDQAVGNFFAGLGKKVWDYFKPGGGMDTQIADLDIWGFLTAPLPLTAEEVGQWFLDLPGVINDFMKRGGGLDQIGRDLIDGFKNGVTEKWNEFTAWIDERWESFKQGFRDAFGIESPSKVFAQFGRDLIQGLINGIVEMYQGVLDWWNQLYADTTRIFTEMKGAVLLTITEWKDGAIQIATDLWSGVQEKWQLLKENSSRIFTETKDDVLGTLVGWKDSAIGIATELWGGVQDRWQRLKENSSRIFVETKDDVIGTIVGWKDSALTLATDIWGGIVERFTRMKEAVVRLFGEMVQGVMEKWDGIRSATAGPINFVINDVLNGGLFKAWNKIIDTLGLNANWKLHVDPIPETGMRGPKTMGVGLAAGGTVPGWSPNDKADNIPAMLTANEFVQPVDAHKFYGTDVMEAMRKKKIPREVFQFLATGGQVFAAIKQRFPRANLNSGLRPGDPGHHGTGNAVDLGEMGFAGGAGRPYLAAMNQALHDTAGPYLEELIYTGAGDNRPDLKKGRPLNYGAATNAAHKNHVHVAVLNLQGFLQAFGSGNVISSAVDAVTGLLGGLWGSATEVFDSLKNSIGEPLAKLGTANPLTTLLGAVSGKLPDAMWGKIKDEVGSMASSVTSAATGAFNFAVDKITGGSVQAVVQSAAAQRGWGSGAQWAALTSIIQRESGWNPNAQNPTSTAYGLFQFLNGTWAGTGIAKTSDPARQTIAGLNYIASRYGDPIGAANFWNRNHWYAEGGVVKDEPETPTLYDSGGWLPPGITTVLNATNRPEPVLTGQAWNELVNAAGSGSSQPSSTIGQLHLHQVKDDLSEAIGEVNHWARVYSNGGRYAGGTP